jgi:hypothetical protein
MPVPSQENDGCPMSVVGNVKTFVAALNAQKKVLENCNFCPGKSLILLNKKVYEPCVKITVPIFNINLSDIHSETSVHPIFVLNQ